MDTTLNPKQTDPRHVLVARAVEAGCAGARLMGAGFGGSVIALARSGDAGEIARRLEADWRVHRVAAVDGALA